VDGESEKYREASYTEQCTSSWAGLGGVSQASGSISTVEYSYSLLPHNLFVTFSLRCDIAGSVILIGEDPQK